MTRTRRSVSARLRGLELPECFAAATVSSAVKASERKRRGDRRDYRRLADQVERLQGKGAL